MTHDELEALGVVALVREVDRLRMLVLSATTLAEDMHEQLSPTDREHFERKLVGLREHVRAVVIPEADKVPEDVELEALVVSAAEARALLVALALQPEHGEENVDEAVQTSPHLRVAVRRLRAFLAP